MIEQLVRFFTEIQELRNAFRSELFEVRIESPIQLLGNREKCEPSWNSMPLSWGQRQLVKCGQHALRWETNGGAGHMANARQDMVGDKGMGDKGT